MNSLSRLVEEIRNVLEGRAGTRSGEVLALEYAQACREVNERLRRMMMMLDGGGEIQGLQEAERSPRLMDQVAELSFGGEGGWQELCRKEGHEVAEWLDERAVDALQGLYGKGLSPNHPLYRDYRAAVLSRNDERAYELVKIIARMNPTDGNAAKELVRMERKAYQQGLVQLRKALGQGDASALVPIMERLENMTETSELFALAEWAEAVARRREHLKQEAWERMPGLLESAEQRMARGEFREAATAFGEFQGLASSHGMAPGSLAQRATTVLQALDDQRKETARQSRIERVSAELAEVADDVETRAVTPMGLTPEFAGPRLEALLKNQRELESLKGALPANLRNRLEATRGQLEQALERRRRNKRTKFALGVGIAALILISAVGFGLIAMRASGHRSALADLRARGASQGVRELVAQLRGDQAWLLRFPSLAGATAEAEQWLKSIGEKEMLATKELADLEEMKARGFANCASSDLLNRLKRCDGLVIVVSADVREDLQSRLTLLRNDAEQELTARQGAADTAALATLNRWLKVLESISLEKPWREAAAAIAGAEDELAPLQAYADHETDLLRLPASTAASVKDLALRLGELGSKLQQMKIATAKLDAVVTADDYHECLKMLGAGTFHEAELARKILDAWPNDERFRAVLLFNGNLTALKAAEGQDGYSVKMPETVRAMDISVITDLRRDPDFSNLWEVEWTAGGKDYRGFSRGPVTEDGPLWRGNIAERPARPGQKPNFRQLNGRLNDLAVPLQKGESPTSLLLERLRLTAVVDDDGTKFTRSVVDLVETVMNDSLADPLAKAYILGRLDLLIEGRENDWGIQYAPELIEDLKEFRALSAAVAVSPYDWMQSTGGTKDARWREFFAKRKNRSYAGDIAGMQKIIARVLKAPMELGGAVRMDASLRAVQFSGKRVVFGLVTTPEGATVLRALGQLNSDGSGLPSGIHPEPLSPLLCVVLNEDEQALVMAAQGLAQPTQP